MLYVIVADNKKERELHREKILAALGPHETLVFDDSMSDLFALEAYLYPSLFTLEIPVVHARFMISSATAGTELWKKFAASPTVYIFEELALPATIQKGIEKAGGSIHTGEKKKAAPRGDFFAAANLLTLSDKKERWLMYQRLIKDEPIEALLGIMYWKLRTLSAANPQYRSLYRALLTAHAHAWKHGTPLALAVEKVLLTEW